MPNADPPPSAMDLASRWLDRVQVTPTAARGGAASQPCWGGSWSPWPERDRSAPTTVKLVETVASGGTGQREQATGSSGDDRSPVVERRQTRPWSGRAVAGIGCRHGRGVAEQWQAAGDRRDRGGNRRLVRLATWQEAGAAVGNSGDGRETPLGPVRHSRETRSDSGGGNARTEAWLAMAEAGEARSVAAEPGAVRGGTTEVPVRHHEACRRGGGGWCSGRRLVEAEPSETRPLAVCGDWTAWGAGAVVPTRRRRFRWRWSNGTSVVDRQTEDGG
uniref:Uncharacterized protein n=1 Tax=Oryza meridionalis TaxID=40149 RepID=A0A0E0EPG0_9ORYZ